MSVEKCPPFTPWDQEWETCKWEVSIRLCHELIDQRATKLPANVGECLKKVGAFCGKDLNQVI